MFYKYCIDLGEQFYKDKKYILEKHVSYDSNHKYTYANLIHSHNYIDGHLLGNHRPKIAYITSYDKEDQKQDKAEPSIINNNPNTNSSLIIKIGHLIVNCEKALKKDYKMENFNNYNIDEEAKNTIDVNLNKNDFKEKNISKSLTSFELSLEKNTQLEYESTYKKDYKLKNKSINQD